ncbi:uncharacterized protein LOC108676684 isoform X2 [Hyalella azteca]|uniref:Uncharacterized protein LOC108676684 isoform X2 n=1 Tax=Hyalella azteca TaxID=294128 RepID=A0A979FL25_HYAAZ|nr:uncharacterized protein LOC108676684 isoform X2 [Hyalella azteca]
MKPSMTCVAALLVVLLVLLQCSAHARAQGQFYSSRYGKREGNTQQSVRSRSGSSGFYANRYGRSGVKLELTPRSNRFIPGSRYGKRSDPQVHNAEEASPPSLLLSDNALCLLVEQPDLYRCAKGGAGSFEEAD